MGEDIHLTERVLGETAGIVHLDNPTDIQVACALMAAQATRELRIFSRDLDARVYDHADFLESVRCVALRSPRASVEILLFDSEPAIHQGNRLVELSRQIPSRIQIRQIPAEFCHRVEAYLLADDQGFVLRPLADLFEGTTDFSAPMLVRHMRNEFERTWERSFQSIELTSFGRGL